MNHLLTFLLLITLSTTLQAQITVEHTTLENTNSKRYATQYLIADRVSLRTGPSATSKLLKSLPIGTAVLLTSKSDSVSTIDGLQSNWYEVLVDGQKGFVWGGFIAYHAFGSNADPSVKFLVGFSHKGTQKNNYNNEPDSVMFGQVRVVKNNVQLDRATFFVCRYPMELHYVDVSLLGSHGLPNVQDVLVAHMPCIGGCGCGTGDHYLFWDGTKLHFAYTTWGVADAGYSEGLELVFPSDMDGTPGYVKTIEDIIPPHHDEEGVPFQDELYGMGLEKRTITTTYYTWNGSKLVKSVNKPVETDSVYYDPDAYKLYNSLDDYYKARQIDEPEEEK